MRSAVGILVLVPACGRIGFDPRDSGQRDTELADASEPGLLLHFAFEADGLVRDRGPRHHDATCTACPTSVAGRVGETAARFSGSSCLSIPDLPDLRPSTFTFALWLNLESSALRSTPIGKADNGATNLNTIEVFVDPGNVCYVGAADRYLNAGALSLSTWHHIAGVFDGSTLTAYLDGAMATSTMAPAVGYTNDPYLIGCDRNFGAFDQYVRGAIDDVRLYDRALAPAEVGALAAM